MRLLIAFLALSFIASMASAHCPLCSAAVGTGVAVSRFYGLDDSVVGLWIGAFVLSTALWLDRALGKNRIKYQTFILIALSFALTITPFYLTGSLSSMEHHKIFGLDRIVFGTILGAFISYFAVYASGYIKSMRGRVLIPFQTIVLSLLFLTIASIALNSALAL